MAIITVARQVAALGDEISAAVAQKLGYKFVGRKEIEKRLKHKFIVRQTKMNGRLMFAN